MKIISNFALIFSLLTIITGCSEEHNSTSDTEKTDNQTDTSATEVSTAETTDDHTLANYKDAYTKHLHLALEVDFDQKKVIGYAEHDIVNNSEAEEIIFDTWKLQVDKVEVDGSEVDYSIDEHDELLGSALHVPITKDSKKIRIHYESTKETQALDWLKPEQTAGKIHPYMYTQGQSIFTRSWIPLQDTPDRRITYSADITVPKELMAVMSASNPETKNDSGKYHFEMPQAIPCYLLALAVGDLDFAAIDHRTGVYTEPSMLAACKNELQDMGEMVVKAEKLYGNYLWDRYDVIVLPPSFPFGGMENPRLTFATPTIIAGDRSLVSLIAHELAHSWSGNLVTNSTWNDFWLNEGFTVYFERRIMEAMYGKDYTDMLALLGYQDLNSSIDDELKTMQSLKLQLMQLHPDNAMSDVAYEKGYFFLRLLEEKAGRDNFDAFLKNYFDTYKFKTITTEEFLSYMQENLIKPHNVEVNVDEWVYGTGIPENCPQVVSTRFNAVEANLEQFYLSNNIENSIFAEDWSTHEWLHFIRHLKPETTSDQMAALDNTFKLTQSGNSEIAAIWFQKSIEFGYDNIDKELEAFLVKVGRRKFLMPLYTALSKTPEGKQKALDIYKKARKNYHYVSYNSIDNLLGYTP